MSFSNEKETNKKKKTQKNKKKNRNKKYFILQCTNLKNLEIKRLIM